MYVRLYQIVYYSTIEGLKGRLYALKAKLTKLIYRLDIFPII